MHSQCKKWKLCLSVQEIHDSMKGCLNQASILAKHYFHCVVMREWQRDRCILLDPFSAEQEVQCSLAPGSAPWHHPKSPQKKVNPHSAVLPSVIVNNQISNMPQQWHTQICRFQITFASCLSHQRGRPDHLQKIPYCCCFEVQTLGQSRILFRQLCLSMPKYL